MDITLQKQIGRGIWVALCAVAIFLAIYWLLPLVYPFIIGWAIAYLLNPAVNGMQRGWRLPRWLAVTIAIVVFLAVAVGIVAIVVSNIAIEIGSLAASLQENINRWKTELINFYNSEFVQSIVQQLSTFYSQNPQYQNTINNNLSSTTRSLADLGSTLVGSVLNGFLSFVASLPGKATVTIIAILAAFFTSKDWYKWKASIASWFHPRVRGHSQSIWADLQKALFGYLRAQLILISITAVIVTIGLIVIGVPYAITVGLLFGAIDLMPYIGVGAAMIPWIVYVFLQGDVYMGVSLIILYGIVLVARQLVEPKVLASSLGLDPLPLLIALFVGLRLFGVIGLIIGPVTLIVVFAFQRAGVFRDIRHYIVHGKSAD